MAMTKQDRPERIIQFGEGGFLRGFVDWFVQKLNEKTDFNGNIVVVQPIEKGMCDALTAQDCLYTHIMRGVEGVQSTIVNSISRCIKPYEDFNAYLKLAENPDLRFIVSNTTEAGIAYHEGNTADDAPPSSFPAKITLLLKRRYDLKLPGFIFLPCELIEKNGDTLRSLILQYGKEWGYGAGFTRFVKEKNIFCNTLVDRINTGYPAGEKINLGYRDDMLNTSEFFHLWVIEGPKTVLEELPLDKADLNVILTEDLSPYRTRKVRILNGAHTSFVPYALLKGFDTVKSCIDDKVMLSYIKSCVYDEIIPTLDLSKEELTAYADDVLSRFANPYIKHMLSSIALNSVSKFKVRVLPSLLAFEQRFEQHPRHLCFSFAQLINFYKSEHPAIQDDPDVTDYMKNTPSREILANDALWGEDLTRFYDTLAPYLVDSVEE